MKIDMKYAPNVMNRLASTKSGAIALALDRVIYTITKSDNKSIILQLQIFVGANKNGSCSWIAPGKSEEYVDTEQVLIAARDELYAVGLGQI